MDQPNALLSDVLAFLKSRIILTACELDLFTLLSRQPGSVEEIAQQKNLELRAATRLLDALAAFGLLEKTGFCYHLPVSSLPLTSGHPETILPLVLHYNHLWKSWSRLSDILRKTYRPDSIAPLQEDSENMTAFIEAMHVVGRTLSEEIAASYDTRPFTRLLDIGGSSGTYAIAFLRRNPALKAVIFDLPQVIPLAEERVRREGFADRTSFVKGDFYEDDFPPGCDLALLSAIIHQNSPEQNLALYRKVYHALVPTGTVLIRDFIMDETRTRPPQGALFA